MSLEILKIASGILVAFAVIATATYLAKTGVISGGAWLALIGPLLGGAGGAMAVSHGSRKTAEHLAELAKR